MMNLPIKIVDLVTLLFLSLLRNIKRFKLRNVKDPHFLACKSIPKELKDAILRKHAISHITNEPEVLLTSNYVSSTDEENALTEFGYRRPVSMKLEEFIDNLVKIEDDTLPKDMLREFSRFYLWAMLDPMKFDNVELRKLNRLINRIIESLASKKKHLYEQITQHRLDLNENGDFDFNKPRSLGANKTNTMKSKSVKFGDVNPNTSGNSNNNNSTQTQSTNLIESPFESVSSHSRSLKIKEQAAKLAKSVFSKKLSSDEPSSTMLLGNGKSSPDAKNTSAESAVDESSFGASASGDTKTGDNGSNPWSTNDDSLKPFDDDNEEIPLVVRSHKTSSKHQHQKKPSLSTGTNSKKKSTSNETESAIETKPTC